MIRALRRLVGRRSGRPLDVHSLRRRFKSPESLQNTKASLDFRDLLCHWRRRRDLNPRAPYEAYSLRRGASSPLEYFSIGEKSIVRRSGEVIGGGDGIRTHGSCESLVFKTSSLNHSDTPPNGCDSGYYNTHFRACQAFCQKNSEICADYRPAGSLSATALSASDR